MKKILALLLSLILVAGCLSVVAFGDEAKEPVTIEWVTAAFNDNQAVVVEELAKRFNEDTGNVIEYSNMDSDAYKQKNKVLLAAGEPLPDVFVHWGGGTFNEYVEAGACLPLDDYIKAAGLEDFWLPNARALCSYDGVVYGFGGNNVNVNPIYYNTEIFEKLGLEVPTTMSEFEAVCDKLIENDIIPFALANNKQWTGLIYTMYLVDRYCGGDFIPGIVAGTTSFDCEGVIKAFSKLQEWVEKGYFPDGVNGLVHSNNDDLQLLYNGTCAMWMYPGSGKVKGDNPEYYQKLDCFEFPVLDDGTGGHSAVGTCGSTFFSISSGCEHPEEAFESMVYMTKDFWLDGMVNAGNIPACQAGIDTIDDPFVTKQLGIVNSAPIVQLAYDQYFTAAVGTMTNSITAQLFGMEITPEDAARQLQDCVNIEYGFQN